MAERKAEKQFREKVSGLYTESGWKVLFLTPIFLPYLSLRRLIERVLSGKKTAYITVLILITWVFTPILNLFLGAWVLWLGGISLFKLQADGRRKERFLAKALAQKYPSSVTVGKTYPLEQPDKSALMEANRSSEEMDLVVIKERGADILNLNFEYKHSYFPLLLEIGLQRVRLSKKQNIDWGEAVSVRTKLWEIMDYPTIELEIGEETIYLPDLDDKFSDKIREEIRKNRKNSRYRKDFEKWRKDAEELKNTGYIDSETEIMELIDELQDTEDTEDFKDGIEELKEKVKDKKKEVVKSYVEKLAENHGRGNSDQIRKLKKSIEKREELEISENLLQDAIEETVEEKEKNALKELLQLHNPEEYEDYIEAFVLEFGKGNKVQRAYLAEILGYWKDKIEIDVEQTFKEKREEKELEQFEENLGITEKESGSSDSKINELESEERKLLENIEKDRVSLGDLEELNGLEFEDFLADLFDKMGYRAKVTTGSNDQGADLIAKKAHEKLVIQAKHHQNNVSNSAVQEVNTAIDYYDGDRGLVIGTSGFTSSAKELARESKVELWDKNKLQKEMEKYLNEAKI
ncbi:MAG: restriction endonuclease Mrr [Candidatus Nanohaloarchaea archaeon]|jgi:restriction endonuclease Mrr